MLEPDKDSSLERGPWQGTLPQAHKGPGLMSQAATEALQPVHYIAVAKDQMEAARLDIMEKVPVQVEVKPGELVMVREFGHLQAVDDGIYK